MALCAMKQGIQLGWRSLRIKRETKKLVAVAPCACSRRRSPSAQPALAGSPFQYILSRARA